MAFAPQSSSQLCQEDLVALVDLARQLAAEVRLTELLPRVLDAAARLTTARAASVILPDRRREGLYIAHAFGPNASDILGRFGPTGPDRIPVERSKAGQVFRTGEPIVESSLADDPERFKGVDRLAGSATTSMVCVPLEAAGARIGVVQLLDHSQGAFTPRDQAILEQFAAIAATAIRNARLFEQLLSHMGYCSADTSEDGPLQVMATLDAPAHSELLTVLFADMRGFTQLCHLIARPERVQSMLTEFIALLTDAIHAEDGILNRFLGDGVMAIFRGEHAAERAVRCADAVVREFAEMRARWDAQTSTSIDFVDVGIGIATDTVILGTLGTDRVRHYTAIGVGVNLAANLCENARDGRRICIDRPTRAAAKALLADVTGPHALTTRPTKPGAAAQEYPYFVVRGLIGASESTSPGRSAPMQPLGHTTAAPIAPTASPAGRIFISYSHDDADWLARLKKHLTPYVRQGSLSIWDDTTLRSGERWNDQIRAALKEAAAAIFLVTPSFVASSFIIDEELKTLFEEAQRRGLPLLWMHVESSAWEETQLKEFQALLPPKIPLEAMSEAEQNAALKLACQTIRDTMRAASRG